MTLLWSWPFWLEQRVSLPVEALYRFYPWRYLERQAQMGYLPQGVETAADTVFMFYPQLQLYNQELKAGRGPCLWNPLNFCGAPMICGAPLAPLYPPRMLLHRLLPTAWAHQCEVLLALVLAGLFTALFLRTLGAGAGPALVAGLAATFGGYSMAWAEFECVTEALAWMAFSLAMAEKVCQEPTRRLWQGALAVGLGLLLLTGHPQFMLLDFLTVVAWLALRGARTWRSWVLPVGLGLGLSAIQLLPSLELVAQAPRPAVSPASMLAENRLLPRQLLTLLQPEILGSSRLEFYLTPIQSQLQNPEEFWIHVGWVPLALAGLGLTCRRGRFFVGLAGFSLLIAMGSPLYAWLSALIPPLAKLVPGRIVSLFSFSLAVLAGLGAQRLSQGPCPRWRQAITVGTLAAWLALGWWLWEWTTGAAWTRAVLADLLQGLAPVGYAGQRELQQIVAARVSQHYAWDNPGFWLTGLTGAALLGLLWGRRRVSMPVLVLLTGLELLGLAARHHRWSPQARLYPNLAALQMLREQAGHDRVAGLITGAKPDSLAVYAIRDVAGYNAAYPAPIYHLFARALGHPPRYHGLLRAEAWNPTMHRLLNLAGARVLYTDPTGLFNPDDLGPPTYSRELNLYPNPEALPRACLYASWGEGDLFASDWNFHERARVEGDQAEGRLTPEDGLEWLRDEPMRCELQVRCAGPRLLALQDADYPGWEARVDGARTPILRVNGMFRGLKLSRGPHRVEFAYRPASLRKGLIVSWLSTLGLTLLVRSRKKAP